MTSLDDTLMEVLNRLEQLKQSVLKAGTTASGSVFKDNQVWIDEIDNIGRLVVSEMHGEEEVNEDDRWPD